MPRYDVCSQYPCRPPHACFCFAPQWLLLVIVVLADLVLHLTNRPYLDPKAHFMQCWFDTAQLMYLGLTLLSALEEANEAVSALLILVFFLSIGLPGYTMVSSHSTQKASVVAVVASHSTN